MPMLIGDKDRLLQVLVVLMRNAIRYTEDGGISLKAIYSFPDKNLLVAVKDSGAGMSAEHINSLFTNFERRMRIDEFNTTGIGLIIAKKVIE